MGAVAEPVHLTRVAYGCTGLPMLVARQAGRADDGIATVVTRYRPKQWEETLGGSLYWIIAHRIVARSAIRGYGEREDGRTDIMLDPAVVAVRPLPRRSHQGWRYLTAADAPADLGEGDDIAQLPPTLLRALADLCLV